MVIRFSPRAKYRWLRAPWRFPYDHISPLPLRCICRGRRRYNCLLATTGVTLSFPDSPQHSLQPDPARVRAGFSRKAARHDRDPFVQNEVRARLLERLDLVLLQPAVVLDLGCGPGRGAADLARRYRRAQVLALDHALPMLDRVRRHRPWWRSIQAVAGDAMAMPLADASVDLVFSSLMLQWCDVDRVFRECRRVLRPGGLLMFTTLGPDTLRELKFAWARVDSHAHVNPFLDMHDIGDALVRARLADPVMDVETLTVTYDAPDVMLRDVRDAGAGNLNPDRAPGLAGRARRESLITALQQQRRDARLSLSMEVVYGHAWAPEKPMSHDVAPGEAHFPVSGLARRSRR